MKIEAAKVTMEGQYRSEKTTSVREALTAWDTRNSAQPPESLKADTVRLSAAAIARQYQANSAAQVEKVRDDSLELSDQDKLKIELIESFIEHLTGKDFKIIVPDRIATRQNSSPATLGAAPSGSLQAPQRGWGIIYSKDTATAESEQTSFQATAFVRTSDGRHIAVEYSFQLAQSSVTYGRTIIRLGDAQTVDPLVLNFDVLSATSTAQKFTFDLNVDGRTEQISFVGPGSGLLAIDKNGDGLINDGDELFGPQSGNGFSELAAYDKDGNGWIDEGDDIYNRLQIWVREEDGSNRLFALGEKGVGAIYLGSVSTPYSLKSSASVDANIRRTGIFLRENGTAGTIQHIDMVM